MQLSGTQFVQGMQGIQVAIQCKYQALPLNSLEVSLQMQQPNYIPCRSTIHFGLQIERKVKLEDRLLWIKFVYNISNKIFPT
jgi:hypothetical protein